MKKKELMTRWAAIALSYCDSCDQVDDCLMRVEGLTNCREAIEQISALIEALPDDPIDRDETDPGIRLGRDAYSGQRTGEGE